MMNKINKYLHRIGFVKGVLVFAFISLFVNITFNLLHEYLLNEADIYLLQDYFNSDEVLSEFWMLDILRIIVVAPLLETFIFQTAVFNLLSFLKIFQRHPCRIVIVGGIFFGLIHLYTLSYIICAALLGIIFMYAYVIKGNNAKGYWTVVLTHSIVNIAALLTMNW